MWLCYLPTTLRVDAAGKHIADKALVVGAHERRSWAVETTNSRWENRRIICEWLEA